MSCIFKRLILFRETKENAIVDPFQQGNNALGVSAPPEGRCREDVGLNEQLNTRTAASEIFH